jgi:hypothetical protein
MAYITQIQGPRPWRAPCPVELDRVVLGRLKGLIYSRGRDPAGHPRTYVHFMRTPPWLASNAQGTQLYILGGRYRVSPRGIEG